MPNIVFGALLLFSSIHGAALAADDDIFEVEAEGRYQMAVKVSMELAKKMALFTAQRKAVDLAGKYLSRKSLVKAFELKQDEIYSLATREIETEIIAEKRETVGKILTLRVRIKARVRPSDFVKAEMVDIELEKEEAKASYSEEMEQPVSAVIDPGKDISKVYRMLREKRWRTAVIYLTHLEKKYPNWAEIQMAKALVYYIFHEPALMEDALSQACLRGNDTACDDLKNIKKVHEYDFGISAAE